MQSFPRSVGHVAVPSKNWFGSVKGYSLLDQMTSRNLSASRSSVEYVNVMLCPIIGIPLLDRMSIQLQFILGKHF